MPRYSLLTTAAPAAREKGIFYARIRFVACSSGPTERVFQRSTRRRKCVDVLAVQRPTYELTLMSWQIPHNPIRSPVWSVGILLYRCGSSSSLLSCWQALLILLHKGAPTQHVRSGKEYAVSTLGIEEIRAESRFASFDGTFPAPAQAISVADFKGAAQRCKIIIRINALHPLPPRQASHGFWQGQPALNLQDTTSLRDTHVPGSLAVKPKIRRTCKMSATTAAAKRFLWQNKCGSAPTLKWGNLQDERSKMGCVQIERQPVAQRLQRNFVLAGRTMNK